MTKLPQNLCDTCANRVKTVWFPLWERIDCSARGLVPTWHDQCSSYVSRVPPVKYGHTCESCGTRWIIGRGCFCVNIDRDKIDWGRCKDIDGERSKAPPAEADGAENNG